MRRKIKKTTYYNKNNEPHREDGPALIQGAEIVFFYLNGKYLGWESSDKDLKWHPYEYFVALYNSGVREYRGKNIADGMKETRFANVFLLNTSGPFMNEK